MESDDQPSSDSGRNDENEQSPFSPLMGVEESAPESTCNKHATKHERKHPLDHFMAVIWTLTLVTTAFAAWYARQQANYAQRSMIYGNVADVVMGQASWRIFPDGLHFIDGWENAGNTQTINMVEHVNSSLVAKPLPDGFFYNDVPSGPNVPISIGAKADLGVDQFTIKIPCLYTLSQERSILYIWGWASYDDVFKFKHHITRFCWQLEDIVVSSNAEYGTDVIVEHNLCSQGNCMDDECTEAPAHNPPLPPTGQCTTPNTPPMSRPHNTPPA